MIYCKRFKVLYIHLFPALYDVYDLANAAGRETSAYS